jgi:beta-glucanase (GH16 family)
MLRGMVGALILGGLVAGGPAPAGATTHIRNATAPTGSTPVPTGPIPVPATLSQWRLVAYDDFTNGLNPLLWGVYSGQPGGDPGGWWSPSHVVVSNGVLNLETYRDPGFGERWVSGGVSNAPGLKQTYGKYEIRMRVGRGRGVAFAALLWPVGSWPPEIDFDELGGATNNRDSIAVSLHYGRQDSQIQRGLKVNLTRWHTVGVEWLPGRLNFTIDGRRWAVIRSPDVPDQPMELDLQTQAGTCDQWWAPCPDTQTPPDVDAQIQWVAEYAYAPVKPPPRTIWRGVSQFTAW